MIKTRLFKFMPGLCFLLALFCCCNLNAQNIDAQKATSLIQKNIGASGLTSADLQNSRISDLYYDKLSGATLVYLQQTLQGIDVDKKIKVFAFKNEKMVSALGDRYATALLQSQKAVTPVAKLSASDAVRAAAAHLNIVISSLVSPKSAKQDATKQTDFGNIGRIENVTAKLIWVTDQKPTSLQSFSKGIMLCWAVDIAPTDSVNAWRVKVDAKTGKVIGKENYTVSCNLQRPGSVNQGYTVHDFIFNNNAGKTGFTGGAPGLNSASYRVVKFPAEAPSFPGGTPSIHTNPWELAGAGNDATTLKWNDDGTDIHDSTKGNNVLAQLNWDNPDALTPLKKGAALSSTPAPDLTFDFNPDFTKQPIDPVNQNFAVTNLFYWNNIVHDLSYQYGFDEASGNFQQNNLGRGGTANDYVIAFAQDGKGQTIGTTTYRNNANFYTPVDGTKPRMRMYLFDGIGYPLTVNSPSSFKGNKVSVESQMSSNNLLINVGAVTGNLVLYDDDTSTVTHIGCVEPSNTADLSGKIALIDRGSCAFTVKVKNAQIAGAAAVIVADNVPGESPFVMSGPDNTITVPAVMISQADGITIKNLLKSAAVNATLKAPIELDGDLDAGVMCHEYTHGISNRLTGGPSNTSCLTNTEQMGEGWSDYDALMFTTDWSKAKVTDGSKPRPVGTYVEGEGNNGAGIRTYPYSTNMNVDPWSYQYMQYTGGEPHSVGEVWCSVLWDMTWNIIQTDGINTNLYDANAAGGNSIALKLVYEGMKLQKCGPGFLDGRDAILAADTLLYEGKYSCAIWKAFTRRGMGILASEGSADVVGDETPYFNNGGLLITKTVDKDSAAQGEELTYTLGAKAVTACGTEAETGKVVDTLPPNVTYVAGSGGVYNSTLRTVTFSGIALNSGDKGAYTFKAVVNSGSYFSPDTLFQDAPKKNVSAIWNNGPAAYKWTVADLGSGTPDYWYYSGDENLISDNHLTTVKAYIVPGMKTTLSFWNYVTMYYSGYNGGVVELSADNGTTWQDLGNYMSGFVYNSAPITAAYGSPIAGRKAFSGSSFGFTTIDLSSFAGENVKIRFRYVTSVGGTNGSTGWLIQGIVLNATPAAYNVAKTFAAETLNSMSSATTYIKDEVLPVVWGDFTATKEKNTALLQWSTVQEINTSSFDIERSNNGVTFTKLGSKAASGNSSITNNYQFTDASPVSGINIYRIKQIDRDGKSAYSVYRPLTFDDLKPVFSITPNPAKDKVTVKLTGNTKLLHIAVVSASGQQVKSFDMNGEQKDLNLPGLASGVYNVIVTGDGVSYKQKVVIQ